MREKAKQTSSISPLAFKLRDARSATSKHNPGTNTIQGLPDEEKCKVIDTLFEHSPVLHSITLPILSHHTFQSYPALIAYIGRHLASMQTDRQVDKLDAILGAHPRLGEKREKVSELSRREQANLNSPSPNEQQEQQTGAAEAENAAQNPTSHRHRGSGNLDGIASELQRWNELYEARFPGLRYVYVYGLLGSANIAFIWAVSRMVLT